MSWDKYENSMDKGPFSGFMVWFGLFVVISVAVSIMGYTLGWFGEAASVAQKEFGATAALQKYEWFVDQSGRIQKMDQDVNLFTDRIVQIKTQYTAYGDPKDWTPDTRVQYNMEIRTASQDLIAVVSQRNNLVREYNAASMKFNWAPFQSKANLPATRYDELPVIN